MAPPRFGSAAAWSHGFLLAFALSALGARAQTVGLHLVSIHVPAHEGQHNFNPGIYGRLVNGVTLGTYLNTLGKQTFYGGYTVERGPFALTLGASIGVRYALVPGDVSVCCDCCMQAPP